MIGQVTHEGRARDPSPGQALFKIKQKSQRKRKHLTRVVSNLHEGLFFRYSVSYHRGLGHREAVLWKRAVSIQKGRSNAPHWICWLLTCIPSNRCWFGKEPGKYMDYIYQGPVILVLLVSTIRETPYVNPSSFIRMRRWINKLKNSFLMPPTFPQHEALWWFNLAVVSKRPSNEKADSYVSCYCCW